MSRCPCCSDTLIQTFQNHQLGCFCRTCWQEMPNLDSEQFRVLLTDASHRLGASLNSKEIPVDQAEARILF